MRAAARAVLTALDTLGVFTLVLGREVIPLLALGAGEDDFVASHGVDPLPVIARPAKILAEP
jgi:hypothetical protein